MLCSDTNRFHLPGSPSTCALDTSITPLPSFLLLAFLATYLPARLFLVRLSAGGSGASFRSSPNISRSGSSLKTRYSAYNCEYSSPSESPLRELVNGGAELPKWLHWTYVALVACLLGLRVLEVVRLVLAEMGVGLLPVAVVANVVNIVMLTHGGLEMGKRRSLAVSATLVVYWAASTVLESVKVARLASYNSLHPAKGTDYPSSDWLLDNGCMLGLLVIFLFLEGAYLVLRWRSSYLPVAKPPISDRTAISKPQTMAEYEYDPVVYLMNERGNAVV